MMKPHELLERAPDLMVVVEGATRISRMQNRRTIRAMANYRVTIDGLWAGRVLMGSDKSKAEWADIVGESPRSLPANAAVPEWREIWVFDSAGIHLLHDKRNERTLSVSFVWDLESVSHPPAKPFSGKLLLNGHPLTAGMREGDLPVEGPIGLAKSIGNRYFGAFGQFGIHLKLLKRRDMRGKRRGPQVLAYAAFGFPNASLPAEIILDRLKRN